MKTKLTNIVQLVTVPILFTAFNIICWWYASYQGLDLSTFATIIGTTAIVAAAGWAYINKTRPKKQLVLALGIFVIVVIAECIVYSYSSFGPHGFENIKY
jgi:Na+-transporting NADH:ubiquinone oxidoreductase subunit NqrE